MNKLFVFLFLVFSILNLNSVLLAQEFPPDEKGFHQMNFDPMERLNLSEEQKTELKDLHFKHQNEMIEANANLQKSELALQELKSNPDYSREEVLAALKKVNDTRANIELLKENHRMDIYEKLNPEQKKMWNEGQKKFHRFKEMEKNRGNKNHNPDRNF
ncbi:MAG TPA: periplasmic heavy metal sensor [Ignavibacteriaceae bacterium]|nr:periplasmic heavy metal sensor [Ignavibacteriaceae bacterium]